MCSMREHFGHIPFVHFLNIVIALVLLAHLLNTYARLPITMNTAVLY